MIRIDALWLSTEPLDMRAGTETALARVVAVFGAARPHHAYLFANRRANRMKVLVHDGIGVCARWRSSSRCAKASSACLRRIATGSVPLPAAVAALIRSRSARMSVIAASGHVPSRTVRLLPWNL